MLSVRRILAVMDGEKQSPEAVRYWYGEQDLDGNDLDRLRESLALTPSERYHRHNRALASVNKIREAVRVARFRKAS
jgi:hypothetical protein